MSAAPSSSASETISDRVRFGLASGRLASTLRALWTVAPRNGADVYVMVIVAEPDSVWEVPAAVVIVAEPAPVVLGQVVVNTDQLRSSLASEGKIALYGLYFDTAKADIKPESKPQLDEMARLLMTDKSLKVTIVGHTDNEGSQQINLTLSKRRAEAVAAALTSQYHVEAGRVRAEGVAALAPVATNRNEAGRAKNRRVEMVEQ